MKKKNIYIYYNIYILFFCSPSAVMIVEITGIACFMCSCFLLAMRDDSIDGIYDTLKQCALISKSAGGIGVAVSCIRATGSYIAGVSQILQLVPGSTGHKVYYRDLNISFC